MDHGAIHCSSNSFTMHRVRNDDGPSAETGGGFRLSRSGNNQQEEEFRPKKKDLVTEMFHPSLKHN